MTFQLHTENRPNTLNLDPTVWVLEDGQGGGIEVWPAHGFNCYRWFVQRDGPKELLYAAADLFQDKRPSRSGIPVLFPFPNRIRAGRFAWDGKEYQLPCNDSTTKNAIHGFACRHPWRIVDQGADAANAWLIGEFHGSKDAPESTPFWPTDCRIRLTYRLEHGKLSIVAKVDNPDGRPLPFGLGYHPYFVANFFDDPQSKVQVPAQKYWELADNLPTGRRLPVDGSRDLRVARTIADVTVDDVLTDLDVPTAGPLVLRGQLQGATESLRLRTSRDFREMVVFTPPHRQAICLEPYTCTTDAIHMQRQGIDAGWTVLGPGKTWTGVVELSVSQ